MALSANTTVDILEPSDRPKCSYGVLGSVHIYSGALVGLAPSGYIKPFVPGDVFVGIADEEYYNSSSTDGAASALGDDGERGKTSCRVVVGGHFAFALTGVAITDVGKPAFATADNAIALTGHPDAFIGYVTDVYSTNVAMIRMRNPGEAPPNGVGSLLIHETYGTTFEPITTTTATKYVRGLVHESIDGAGLTNKDAEDGGVVLAFDAVAEAALASIYTLNDTLPVDKGLTFECTLCMTNKGDAAAIDLDFGFGTALTANSKPDIDHADMAQLAVFHMDGNSDNILAQSDDATTDVAAVDTTIDNDSTTDVAKKFKIIVRPTGAVEFWINGARVLSSTTFAVLSTANLAAFINLEKTSDDTVAEVVVTNLRIGAGKA